MRNEGPPPMAHGDRFLSSPPQQTPGPALDPETRLGRFTIVRHVGSGRSTHVYEARDELRAQSVALKIADLQPDVAEQIEARMRHEIDVGRHLGGHRHVLAMFDTHRCQYAGLDLQMISMEFADGGDFRDWLASNRDNTLLRRDTGVQHVIDAASGLAALHRAGVAHFDLKPENMFCVNGTWKIGDLDQAASPFYHSGELAGEDNPASPTPRGTPGYQSPELAVGTRPKPDTRADIYALGVILGEVLDLTGSPSARHRPEEGLLVAEDLVRIVERCTAPDPGDRFQLVEHFIEALQLAHQGESRHAKGRAMRAQEGHWRDIRRCLDAGRTKDARRLCQILLRSCPHHAGACVVLANLDRQHDQGVSAARELGSNIENLLLSEAFAKLRAIVDLTPDDQSVIDLVECLETRIDGSVEALFGALSLLATGDFGAALGAFEQAAAHDTESAAAAEACVLVGDLSRSLRVSQRRIETAIGRGRYTLALRLTEAHQRQLTATTERALHIRASLESRDRVKEGTTA